MASCEHQAAAAEVSPALSPAEGLEAGYLMLEGSDNHRGLLLMTPASPVGLRPEGRVIPAFGGIDPAGCGATTTASNTSSYTATAKVPASQPMEKKRGQGTEVSTGNIFLVLSIVQYIIRQ